MCFCSFVFAFTLCLASVCSVRFRIPLATPASFLPDTRRRPPPRCRRCTRLVCVLLLTAALVPAAASLSMDVDLSQLLYDKGLGSAESPLLAHGVSNLHTLKILEDADVDSFGMLPMVAKLFKKKHRELIEDLAAMKAAPPLGPTAQVEADKKKKKAEFLQDLLLILGVGGGGMVILLVYVFLIKAPNKAEKAD